MRKPSVKIGQQIYDKNSFNSVVHYKTKTRFDILIVRYLTLWKSKSKMHLLPFKISFLIRLSDYHRMTIKYKC